MHARRSSRGDLLKLLEGAPAPIYAVDHDRTIVFCNSACADWVGMASEQLIGQVCGFHSTFDERSAAGVAAALCPPPVSLGGQRVATRISVVNAQGQTRTRRAEFVPLAEGGDLAAPVLAILATADCSPADADDAAEPESRQLHETLRQLRRELAGQFQLDRLIGRSPPIVRARAQAAAAAALQVNVAIIGPPGCGKEHLARAIHYSTVGADRGPLVPLDCAALDGELMRSTLSALVARGGQQHQRDEPGSLLLRHVEQMPAEVQPELARLLAAGALGARVICTSLEPLEASAASGQLRHDLACALGTIVVALPPLAERTEDVPLLAQALFEEINARGDKQLAGFTPEALDLLAAHGWPDNVDSLTEVVGESHAAASGALIAPRDLPKRIHLAADAAAYPRRQDEPIDLEQYLLRVELELVRRALAQADGNKARAARLLGLTRPKLYRRLIQLGLASEESEP